MKTNQVPRQPTSSAAYGIKMKPEIEYSIVSYEESNDGDDDSYAQSVVIQKLIESNVLMSYLIGNTNLLMPGDSVLYMQDAYARINQINRMHFYHGLATQNIINDTINELKLMVAHNTKIVDSMEDGTMASDVAGLIVADNKEGQSIFIYKLRISHMQLCPQCGTSDIHDGDLSIHMRGSRCLARRIKNTETSNCFEPMSDEYENIVLKTTNVPHKMVASSYDLWAPQWVSKAIEYFTNNGGYADLTIEQYLDKMAQNQVR
jgi:hypothetical protein